LRYLNSTLPKDKAVVRFADWLTTATVEREVSAGLGAGKAKIVLCGHRFAVYEFWPSDVETLSDLAAWEVSLLQIPSENS
jgi:hypothetical protein